MPTSSDRSKLVSRVIRETRHLYSFLNDRGVSVRSMTNLQLLAQAKKLGYKNGGDFIQAHEDLKRFDGNLNQTGDIL